VKNCPYCQKEISDETTFCWYCGRELVARPERPEAVRSKPLNTRLLIILGGILLAIILLAVLFIH
jgi:predicted amidophosphoribosyltransferase